jgi:hypothetical protein
VSSLPYGPNTAVIRRFLVRLAGLGSGDKAAVVARYGDLTRTKAWETAESLLGTAIERSGREPQRDALSGPLLQLVRPAEATATISEDEALAQLDPVAEPALAALLALMVRDLLPEAVIATLVAPFDGIVEVQ